MQYDHVFKRALIAFEVEKVICEFFQAVDKRLPGIGTLGNQHDNTTNTFDIDFRSLESILLRKRTAWLWPFLNSFAVSIFAPCKSYIANIYLHVGKVNRRPVG